MFLFSLVLLFFLLHFFPSPFHFTSCAIPPFSFFHHPLACATKRRGATPRGAVGLTPLNERRSVVVQVPERVCTLATDCWTRTSVAVAGVGRKRFGSDYVRRRGGGREVRSSRAPIETGVVSDRPSRRVELPSVCDRSLRARSQWHNW